MRRGGNCGQEKIKWKVRREKLEWRKKRRVEIRLKEKRWKEKRMRKGRGKVKRKEEGWRHVSETREEIRKEERRIKETSKGPGEERKEGKTWKTGDGGGACTGISLTVYHLIPWGEFKPWENWLLLNPEQIPCGDEHTHKHISAGC